MKHNFTKHKFTDNQLKLILQMKDVLNDSRVPEHQLDGVFDIIGQYHHIKELKLSERIKIVSIHSRWCAPVCKKRLTKLRLHNENESSKNCIETLD